MTLDSVGKVLYIWAWGSWVRPPVMTQKLRPVWHLYTLSTGEAGQTDSPGVSWPPSLGKSKTLRFSGRPSLTKRLGWGLQSSKVAEHLPSMQLVLVQSPTPPKTRTNNMVESNWERHLTLTFDLYTQNIHRHTHTHMQAHSMSTHIHKSYNRCY